MARTITATSKTIVPKKTKTIKSKEIKPLITSGAVKRLCVLAGVKRITKSASDQVKQILKARVAELLKSLIVIVEYARRRTILHNDLVFLVRYYGGKEESKNADIKLCKNKKALKNKNAGKCIVISRTGFKKMVKMEIDDLRVSKTFMLHFQYFVESEMVKMLRAAHDAAVDVAGRETLSLKDINYVQTHNCTYKGEQLSSAVIEQMTTKKTKKAGTKHKKNKKAGTKKATKKSPIY